MNYKQHFTIGVTTYVGLGIIVPGIDLTLPGVIASSVFSLLPDLDQLQSKISQYLFKLPTKIMMHLVNLCRLLFSSLLLFVLIDNTIFSINYHSTYEHVVISLVAAVMAFLLLEPDETFIKRRVAESIGIIFFVYGILHGEMRFVQVASIIITYTISGHRSIVSHSLLSLFVIAKMTYNTPIMIGALIGYSLHLLCDHIFKDMNCPLFFPIDVLIEFTKRDKKKNNKSNKIRDFVMLCGNILISFTIY